MPTEKSAARLAQEIARIILEEDLKPGDRYLGEAEALKRHGVSRSTLREALRFLEIQGVVRIRRGPSGGPVITRPTFRSLASTLALLLQFEGAPLRQVAEARTVMEPGMATLVVRFASDDEIAEMGDALARAESSVSDYPTFLAAYHAYWDLLAKATHNAVIALLSPALRAVVETGNFVPDEVQRVLLVERLGAFHQALVARESELARERLAAIENAFLQRLVEGYPKRIEQPIAWADLDADESGRAS